jgi:hypothetical protein
MPGFVCHLAMKLDRLRPFNMAGLPD